MSEQLKSQQDFFEGVNVDDFDDIQSRITNRGYNIAEFDGARPWGGFFRLDSEYADRFVRQFFPGLTPEEARLGNADAELSPKFLVVKPGQRLSWQYHDRRAERWCFLTNGAYRRSETDEEGPRIEAVAGEVVQFAKGERHRLEGLESEVVLVAEIWQHTDPSYPSNESDIVRLADDYQR